MGEAILDAPHDPLLPRSSQAPNPAPRSEDDPMWHCASDSD